ncbi:MAG: ribosome biogenesis GTPase Der [bacterium TMED198]|nr:MAG: ribosome biogenesis GTPase Der [bacterium TMED198]
MSRPTIAIIGRPNVGKSTLFNKLVGGMPAIVSPVEGVTRDRVYGVFEWSGRNYNIIDTGGYTPKTDDIILKNIRIQAIKAFDEADIILFVINGREGLTSSDRELGLLLTNSSKKTILVANKMDNSDLDENLLEYYELGFGEPLPISAQNSRNINTMLDAIQDFTKNILEENLDNSHINLAIVGMPNVGKSSLMNSLVKTNKSIVTSIAGTTRDSVDSYITYFKKTYRIIDTAGLRKKNKIDDSIEFYSSVRTYKVIDDCDLAILMVDGQKHFNKQDKEIASYIIEKGKGLMVVINKWDLISKDTHTMKNYKDEILYRFSDMQNYPIIFISILENLRIQNILKEGSIVFKKYQNNISTKKLNEFLGMAIKNYNPPAVKGRNLTIKYVAQVRHSPPVFVFFTNFPQLFPKSYRKYLENQLRSAFDLSGVPIKIIFRKK